MNSLFEYLKACEVEANLDTGKLRDQDRFEDAVQKRKEAQHAYWRDLARSGIAWYEGLRINIICSSLGG